MGIYSSSMLVIAVVGVLLFFLGQMLLGIILLIGVILGLLGQIVVLNWKRGETRAAVIVLVLGVVILSITLIAIVVTLNRI